MPRLLAAGIRSYRRVLPLMRDERVPTALKAGAIALALLIISPLDVFGDIPVLGLFDDAGLLTLLCIAFVWLATSTIEKNVTPREPRTGPPAIR